MNNPFALIKKELADFTKLVGYLYDHISYNNKIIEIVNDIGDDEILEEFYSLKEGAMISFYNGIIISLYGYYEKAIKQMATIFANFKIEYLSFGSRKIKNSYLNSVIKNLERDNESEALKRINQLNSALNNNDFSNFSSSIMFDGFQNLRFDELTKLCSSIEINNLEKELFCTDTYIKYYMKKK